MNKITLNGRVIELLYNVKATIDIAEICDGDVANLADIMNKNTFSQNMKLICDVICALANGAVTKRNADVVMGLDSGEKRPEYPVEYFLANITIENFDDVVAAVFAAIGLGSEFTVPDNVKTEEKDIDLAEIEAEKNESKKS